MAAEIGCTERFATSCDSGFVDLFVASVGCMRIRLLLASLASSSFVDFSFATTMVGLSPYLLNLVQLLQPLQQQFLRTSGGKEALLAHQAGNVHGGANFSSASGSMQIPQQSRKFIDSGQHQASLNIPEQAFNRSQGFEQQMLNPIQQAYLQYAFQDAQQKPTVGWQSHHQMKPGMFGALGKDQEIYGWLI
ncbi:ATP-dependent helicase BRM [Olea europaea subsp. europaea]|uniref:ATP-dependent helicase BRM n=1 Tax=Olea europaea subsp. europaea TaxID=158383 RepID=A0A8S0TK74_OLEEU|nr:ATP-dependent helicase BRM [Olea europaea subsp. europaea]